MNAVNCLVLTVAPYQTDHKNKHKRECENKAAGGEHVDKYSALKSARALPVPKKITNFTPPMKRFPAILLHFRTCSVRVDKQMQTGAHTLRAFLIAWFLLIGFGGAVQAGTAEKGFAALSLRDYFRAKKAFESAGTDPYCCYGLAIVYSRNDNPYTNIDSAVTLATRGYHYFLARPKARSFVEFRVDSASFITLLDTLSHRKWSQVRQQNSIWACNAFLSSCYAGNKSLRKEAADLRDELELNRLMQLNRSDSTAYFLATHPESSLYAEAELLRDRQLFDEYTVSLKAASYRSFIRRYAGNAMVATARERLFALYKQQSDTAGLREFVHDFPEAPQTMEAWKLLFALTVRSYTDVELNRFLKNHPDFPLRNSILKELELNKLVVYPYLRNELVGFIDSSGRMAVPPQYDEAGPFAEGLSVVSRNDTVFYVNKAGENPFPVTYSAAGPFRHGMAPVKRLGRWHFINRQGQVISRDYDEIGELSGDVYVVKTGGLYGALNSYGQSLIEPSFEKLGDFTNGFAYYTQGTKYGFVDVSGDVQRAVYEWISAFGNDGLAIVRRDQKYGLLNAAGRVVLAEQYDKVLRAAGGVYIVVNGSQYGFYSAEGCFLTPLAYDYQGDKNTEFYTDGQLLKLIRKGQQGLANRNGALVVPFDEFTYLGFPQTGMVLAGKDNKKEQRFGYLGIYSGIDLAPRYSAASPFQDSVAVVTLKDRNLLIGQRGEERYASASPIERLSSRYFLVKSVVHTIIDRQGHTVLTDVSDVQSPSPGIWIVTVYGGEIKLLRD